MLPTIKPSHRHDRAGLRVAGHARAVNRAGMTVARLNFSHGDRTSHAAAIQRIHAAEAATAGGSRSWPTSRPKMRLGKIDPEAIELRAGDVFTLTAEDIVGDRQPCLNEFQIPPQSRQARDRLFLNDGLVHLLVEACRAPMSAAVWRWRPNCAQKGLNLPGIDLGSGALHRRGPRPPRIRPPPRVDAVSQSFVRRGGIERVGHRSGRARGDGAGGPSLSPRSSGPTPPSTIWTGFSKPRDGSWSRADLGVEVPIEEIAVTQNG